MLVTVQLIICHWFFWKRIYLFWFSICWDPIYAWVSLQILLILLFFFFWIQVALTHGPESVKPQVTQADENGKFCFQVCLILFTLVFTFISKIFIQMTSVLHAVSSYGYANFHPGDFCDDDDDILPQSFCLYFFALFLLFFLLFGDWCLWISLHCFLILWYVWNDCTIILHFSVTLLFSMIFVNCSPVWTFSNLLLPY